MCQYLRLNYLSCFLNFLLLYSFFFQMCLKRCIVSDFLIFFSFFFIFGLLKVLRTLQFLWLYCVSCFLINRLVGLYRISFGVCKDALIFFHCYIKRFTVIFFFRFLVFLCVKRNDEMHVDIFIFSVVFFHFFRSVFFCV